jgi:hypothetical protein
MRRIISEMKARSAVILGEGAMLKVLLISLALVIAAFIVVFLIFS